MKHWTCSKEVETVCWLYIFSCKLRKTSINSSQQSRAKEKKRATLFPHINVILTYSPGSAYKRLKAKIMKITLSKEGLNLWVVTIFYLNRFFCPGTEDSGCEGRISRISSEEAHERRSIGHEKKATQFTLQRSWIYVISKNQDWKPTAMAAGAVRAQPTPKWDKWMCARFFLKFPRQRVAVERSTSNA